VESSTALVERYNGRLELIRWRAVKPAEAAPVALVDEPHLLATMDA
jgi:hypothetical protein